MRERGCAELSEKAPPGASGTGRGDIGVHLTMVAARAGAETDSAARSAEAPPAETKSAEAPVLADPPEIREPEARHDAVREEHVPAQVPPVPVADLAPVSEPAPVPESRPDPMTEPVVDAPSEPAPVPETAHARPLARPAPPVRTQSETVTDTEIAVRPEARPGDRQVPASSAMRRGGGQIDAGATADSEDARDAVGDGVAGVVSDRYAGRLRAWLERHKTYPREARRKRLEGVVYLYFRASRDGRVVSHEIRKSSGFVLLDRETEALLQRAQPLPAFTSGMTAAYIDIVVPIDYSLRRR